MPGQQLSLLLALPVLLLVALLVLRHRAFVLERIRTFFTEPGPAVNLAIFRIVFYATALPLLLIPPSQVAEFSRLPDELLFPPPGLGWLVDIVPISAGLVWASFVVLVVTSVTACVGLLTRASSIVWLLAASYYLTVPQLYGKVNHYSIVLWVAALFAVSRAADVWSVDSVFRSGRDARAGRPAVPAPDVRYSLPLRLTWLFLGLSYLLPGLFKYGLVGLAWASPENMRNILYQKWFELGGYRPPVPVDQFDPLILAMGLGTIFFEVTFIVWIFDRRTRWLSPAMGVFFHASTNLAMRIGFYSSLILYSSFVDWDAVSRRLAARREPMTLAVDAQCGTCRSTGHALQRVALPGALRVVSVQSGDPLVGHDLPQRPSEADMLTGTHLFVGSRTYVGYLAYRRSAWRIPVLWPVLPLLYLPPVRELVEAVHDRVAASQARTARSGLLPPSPSSVRTARRASWSLAGPVLIAAAVLAGTAVSAAANTVRTWPISMYPTFAYRWAPEIRVLEVVPAGTVDAQARLRDCFEWMPDSRYGGLVNAILHAPRGEQEPKLRALVTAAGDDCAATAGDRSLEVRETTVSVLPDTVGEVHGRKVLLAVER